MEVHGQEYEIEVRVSHHFHGKHSLPARPEMHGHRWEVEFAVCGPLNPASGMVADMLDLSRFFKPYIEKLDGYNLHECPELQHSDGLLKITSVYPTCDTLAHYFLWKTIPDFREHPEFAGLRISQVKVSIFEPDGNEPWGHAVIRPKLS